MKKRLMMNLLYVLLTCVISALPTSTNPKKAVRPNNNIPGWATPILSQKQIDAAKMAGVRPAIEIEIGHGITVRMVFIPPGEFTMGSPSIEAGGYIKESPQHKVKIFKGYYMCVTEVTQAQWKAVMGENTSWSKNQPSNDTPNHPVECISWNDIQRFLVELNNKIEGRGFRLPSEAVWEYACRAGTTSRYCFGAEDGHIGEYAWYSGNSGQTSHPVGIKRPNKWGLYDMHGNVNEWCEDDFHDSYWGAPDTGKPWVESPRDPGRLLRGGYWLSDPWFCRSATRQCFSASFRKKSFGFRFTGAIQK